MTIYIRNRQRRIKVNQRKIQLLLGKTLRLLGFNNTELSVLFVNDIAMQRLNIDHRGIDKTTDVLSFPQYDTSEYFQHCLSTQHSTFNTQHVLLGDIVINLHKAQRQAAEYGVSFDEELKRLLIHGLLHLIGYDHEQGRYAAGKMKKKERELFDSLSIQESRLIMRRQ